MHFCRTTLTLITLALPLRAALASMHFGTAWDIGRITGLASTTATGSDSGDRAVTQTPDSTGRMPTPPEPVQNAEDAGGRITVVPADQPVRRISVKPGEAGGVREGEDADIIEGTVQGDPTGTLVFSSTNGQFMYSPMEPFRIGDDVRVTPRCDCEVTTLVIRVGGGGSGDGPGFTVEYGLYDDCPEYGTGPDPLYGSVGTVDLPDDGIWEIVIDYSSLPVLINRNAWVAVAKSTTEGGWLYGTAPELGYSMDYFYHPYTGCRSGTGDSYTSFYIQLYCARGSTAPMPADSNPADNEENVPLDAVLSWNSGSQRAAARVPVLGRTKDPAVEPHVDPDRDQGVDAGPKMRSFCETQERFFEKYPLGRDAALECMEGICDYHETRDAFIPDDSTTTVTFRMVIHVFCDDDGTNCVSSAAEVDAQIAQLNLDFTDAHMQFVHEVQYHHNSRYRNLESSEQRTMKVEYVDSPESKLNVYVVNRTDSDSSWATFPWDGDALYTQGGILMHAPHFCDNCQILAHEVGHCIGLWHTFHNVDDESDWDPATLLACNDSCRDKAGAVPSDRTGDLCSDTAPTPMNFDCHDPPGADPCTGVSWAPTNYTNYMGYNWCMDEWTPQQMGRTHCWSEELLAGWMEDQCATTYDVYLDTETPPATLVCSDLHEPTCDPGELACDIVHYWQVVSHMLELTTPGPVWSFTTIGGDADCNANGTPDLCELSLGEVPDCQGNRIPDECDVDPADPDGDGEVSSDLDNNGIPDECMAAFHPPQAAASPHNNPKNRYVSVDPSTSGNVAVAIEVTLSSMKRCSGDDRRACKVDGDCPDVCSGDRDLQCSNDAICEPNGPCVPTGPCVEHTHVGSVTRWVDLPFTSTCTPLFDCADQSFAYLVHDPVYRVWTETVLHITDCEIVPVAGYDLRATVDSVLFSDRLTITTIEKPQVHYGDCVGPVAGGSFTPPDGYVNVTDVQAYLIANQGGATAPHTTWVDVQSGSMPVVPQQILNIGDLQTIKFGFLGNTYVETPGQENPSDCP